MQLLIRIELDRPLLLPRNHKHKVTALIYKSLGNSNCKDFSRYLHDFGALHGKRSFRLFTFSELTGPCEESGNVLAFYDNVSLEIRSIDPVMIRLLIEGITNRGGIEFDRRLISADHIRMIPSDYTVESNAVLVRMKTPVTVYSTKETMCMENGEKKNKHRVYFSPDHPEFKRLVVENFTRKYYACYQIEPEEEIEVIPYQDTDKSKVWYKTDRSTEIIEAYGGEYVIAGNRKYLDFLYQTGLGGKNSQGFGMFDVVAQVMGGDDCYYDVADM